MLVWSSLVTMSIPSGVRHQLLSPFDPRQEPGRHPRVYPLHLMELGDWFAVDDCTPHRVRSIRSAVVAFRRIHCCRRFAVRRAPDLGASTWVCARIA